MSFLDKVMFWKKKDDFSSVGLGDSAKGMGTEFNTGEMGGMPSGGMPSDFGGNYGLPPEHQPAMQDPLQSANINVPQYAQPQVQQQGYNDYRHDTISKDLEIISTKLDALRAAIESINQRLSNIESMAASKNDDNDIRRKYYRY